MGEEMTTPQQPQEKKKGKKKLIIILLVVLLLAAAGAATFMSYKGMFGKNFKNVNVAEITQQYTGDDLEFPLIAEIPSGTKVTHTVTDQNGNTTTQTGTLKLKEIGEYKVVTKFEKPFYKTKVLDAVTVAIDNIVEFDQTGCATGEIALKGLSEKGKTLETLVIPSTYKNSEGTVLTVTSIANKAFYKNNEAEGIFTSVYIPETVTKIGQYAFCKCGLTTVTIPKSVTSIEQGAFENSASLESVVFENGINIETIEKYTFRMTALKAVDIPSSVKEIKDGAFNNTKLEKITIPANVEVIGEISTSTSSSIGVFSDCKDLAEVTFAEGSQLKLLGFKAFAQLSVAIKDKDTAKLTKINNFEKCSNLMEIESSIFKGAHVSKFTFPNNQDMILYGPPMVGMIIDGEAKLPDSIKTKVSKGYDRLKCSFRATYIGYLQIPDTYKLEANDRYIDGSNIGTLIMPRATTTIGAYVFSNFTVNTIWLPKEVTKFANSSFDKIKIPKLQCEGNYNNISKDSGWQHSEVTISSTESNVAKPVAPTF